MRRLCRVWAGRGRDFGVAAGERRDFCGELFKGFPGEGTFEGPLAMPYTATAQRYVSVIGCAPKPVRRAVAAAAKDLVNRRPEAIERLVPSWPKSR